MTHHLLLNQQYVCVIQLNRTTRALLMATRTRLHPVLMTTLSMIIGLLPIALASGAASEWKNGIAWVLIGGLTSSMLLTLVVVPVVYSLMENIKIRIQGWFLKKNVPVTDTEITATLSIK